MMMAALAILASASFQAAEAGQVGAHAEVSYATFFLKGDNPPWVDAKLDRQPDQSLVSRVVPFKSGQFGMIEFSCSNIDAAGHLVGCRRINIEPDGLGYEQAADKILPTLQFFETQITNPRSDIKFISVQLRLWNSDKPDLMGPCWEPTCITEPPPPPPPHAR